MNGISGRPFARTIYGPLRAQSSGIADLDLVTDPAELLAITALLELRLQQLIRNPEQFDPGMQQPRRRAVDDPRRRQRRAAARDSLNATLRHWGNGETIRCDDWVNNPIDQVAPWRPTSI